MKFEVSLQQTLGLNSQKSEFNTRTIIGILIIIVMIAAILINEYTYGILFLGLTIAASFEYMHITGLNQIASTKKWVLTLVNVGVFLLGYGIAIEVFPLSFRMFGIIPMFLLFSVGLMGKTAPNYKLSSILIAGHVYIGIPLMLLSYIYIHKSDFWPSYVLAILAFVWSNDIGAYLVGRNLGKTKLIPRVSPKKTWEGLIGGFLITLVIGYVYSIFSKNLSVVQWVAMAAVVSLGSSFGDLIASSLKRSFGVKDSGRFFPGHGGMIDRFDGFFIAIVFAFTYLSLLGVIR